MDKWDKVTLNWDFSVSGLGTGVLVEGGFDPTIHDPYVFSGSERDRKTHHLIEIEAISMPQKGEQRKGEMTVDIKIKHNLTPHYETITQRLREALDKLTQGPRPIRQAPVGIIEPQGHPNMKRSWMDTKYSLSFVLANGEQFCDSSIEIARTVFEGLGVKDPNGYSLANFSLQRETFVNIDGSWITFPRWLRMHHRLPIYGPEDRG